MSISAEAGDFISQFKRRSKTEHPIFFGREFMQYLQQCQQRGGNGAIGGGRSIEILVSRILPILILVLTVVILPTTGNGAIGG